MVQDEGGLWSAPISIYSDRNVELLVSSILTIGGIGWDGPKYKKDGQYSTYIYAFEKTDRECVLHRIPPGHETDEAWLKACAALKYTRRFFFVDTRNRTATLKQWVGMDGDGEFRPELMHFEDVTIPLDGTVNPKLCRALTRLKVLIDQEIRGHPEM